MASKYPVALGRILIDHSLGGLMSINILLKHTSLFSKYVAIDPSMWWDNQKLLAESKRLLQNKEFAKKELSLTIANTRDKDMETPAVIRMDTTRKAFFNRPSLLLADDINSSMKNKLIF